jgi:hypothetical protein
LVNRPLTDPCPTLSPDKLKQAEHNFGQYLEIAYKIVAEADQKHATENRDTEGNVAWNGKLPGL